MFDKMGGLGGMLRAAGDRAADAMYGDRAGALRAQVWRDFLGGIGESMGGGDVMAPAHDRLARQYPQIPAAPAPLKACDCGNGQPAALVKARRNLA